MRYYKIVITNPDTGAIVQPPGEPDPTASYTSYYQGSNGQGVTIPGARNVELDIPSFDFATPAGAGFVRVWGISLAEIRQSNNLNNLNIAVYGGMQAGLPLANPAQAGLLIRGTISQAFGNWVGKDMTLDMTVAPAAGSPDDPLNLNFFWAKGTSLNDNIKTVLSQAFPNAKVNMLTADNLILTEDTVGLYQTLDQFASYVQAVSVGYSNDPNYYGIKIVLKDNVFNVYDGTTQTNPTAIAFQDMIGQPTWISPLELQVKLVMRGDLAVGDYLQLPAAQVTTTGSGAVPYGVGISQQSAFQGTFQINSLRHVGNFRQSNAESWATNVDCTAQNANG